MGVVTKSQFSHRLVFSLENPNGLQGSSAEVNESNFGWHQGNTFVVFYTI